MIPDGWSIQRVKDVGRVVTGTTPSTGNNSFYGGDTPFVAPGDLGKSKFISSAEKTLTRRGLEVSRPVPAGSTLFTCIGSTIGKTGFATREVGTNQQINAVVPAPNHDPEFIYYQLCRNAESIRRLAGKQAVPLITKAQFGNENIPMAPIGEQRRIAEILGAWDHAIETVDRLIANAHLQRRALMQKLLAGKQRLPGFLEPWVQIRIGDLLKEVRRDVVWDDRTIYNLLSIRRRSEGIFHRESLIGRAIITKTMKEARTGDFLISKMQVLHGASALVPPEFDGFHISGSYVSLTPRSSISFDIRFFDWISKTPALYEIAFQCSYGVHIEKMTFSLSSFLKRSISIPPNISEQAAIADLLAAADRQLAALKHQTDLLRQEKSALMQQLLTGKRRVKLGAAAA